MSSRTSLFSYSILGLAVLGLNLCSAQVCPNLAYPMTSIQIGSGPQCAVSGDVNGDGRVDILVGRSPLFIAGGLSLLINAGNGLFTTTEVFGVYSPRALALGDMDLDGDLDLVVSEQGVLGTNGFDGDGVLVFINDGQGHFSAMPLNALAANEDELEGIRLGDLDADGDLDVVAALRNHPTGPLTGDSRVLVYLNSGVGNLTLAGDFPAGSKPGAMVLGDFNADGALDYATLDTSGLGVSVALGHGNGSFDTTATAYVIGTYPSGLASGDFDGDGDIDLVAGAKYGLRVLVNQGNGTFVAGPLQFFGYYNKSMAVGDFNQDGKADLLATFASPADVKMLAGNGNGTFSVYRSFPAGTQVYAMTLGDWNGDSILDVAAADSNGSEVRIWSSVCGTWTYCTAKTNSLGCVPQIGFTGTPSMTAGSGFVITASNLRNGQSSMLFYGISGRANVPFLGGTLCVAGPLRRAVIQNSGGSATGADCTGSLSFDFNTWISRGFDSSLAPGTRVDAQFYSRDAGFQPPNSISLTDAVEFTLEP